MVTQQIQVKAHDFESPFTNNEVAVEFRKLVEADELTSDFARDLYAGAKRYKRYTPGQIPWLHVLVAQHHGRQTQPNMSSAALTGLGLVHKHLADCRKSRDEGGKGLLHPMIGLLVGEQNVVLKLAGPKSKNNGKVSVASDHRYGHGDFYGWIDVSGEMESRKSIPQAVVDILIRVGQDPARVISEIGKESGRCCYCFSELTTVPSKIAGAGKTCSDNYGVDYPRAAAVRQFVQDSPEILEGASDRDKWEPQTA